MVLSLELNEIAVIFSDGEMVTLMMSMVVGNSINHRQ